MERTMTEPTLGELFFTAVQSAKREAWDEGFDACAEYGSDIEAWRDGSFQKPGTPRNPYRGQEDTDDH